MPRPPRLCPARVWRLRRFLPRTLRCAAALTGILTGATPALAEPQAWSVYAFGLPVGELRLAVSEAAGRYTGTGAFQTTGLAGVLKRIRFTVSARGRVGEDGYAPSVYEGFIDTGRRLSETRLEFAAGLPVKTAGAQAPATPIAVSDMRGAQDPMTVMWQVLRDQSDQTLCRFSQNQFDGTRLVRISLTTREQTGDSVTCSGTYDRIGGYSPEELAEMAISPLSVTYTRTGDAWRATGIRVRTRHGTARLRRQD